MTSIDTVITPKAGNAETCIIMSGDYTPHMEYELEDAEVAPQTRQKFDKLIKKYDCIVSKHTNDINTTPLLKSGNRNRRASYSILTICTPIETSLVCSISDSKY